MIVVNGLLETTEENLRAIKHGIGQVEVASQAEAGCHDYTFSVELNNPNILRITECWDSPEALQAHFQAEHMATFQALLAEHQPIKLEVKFYEAQVMPSPFD